MYSPRASPAVGAMFGTPDSARRVPNRGGACKFMLSDEQRALQDDQIQLPPSLLSSEMSCEPHQRRNEPTVDRVWEALHKPPAGAPSSGSGAPPPRYGNVLASPRRISNLGETQRHASEWNVPKAFNLETPYPIATKDSRFVEAEADKAALAAVAYTAGYAVAAPTAGMTTGKQSTKNTLPSMRPQMMNNGQA